MAISTHAELKTAVANWLSRDNLAVYLDDFITLAEAKMNRDLAAFVPGLRAMELTATGTQSTETLAIPSGYLSMKRLTMSIGGQDRVLEYVTEIQSANFDLDGLPLYYTTRGNNIVFAPVPASGYDYELVYYAKIAPLADGTNWIIENAPDLYLYGTLLQATPFIKDDKRIAIWAAAYDMVLKAMELQNKKDRISGSTLRQRARGAV